MSPFPQPAAAPANRLENARTVESWLETGAAVGFLGMSRSKLHELKRAGELRPGEHWIKAGGAHGRLLWSIPAIRCWQVDQTISAALLPETYSDIPVAGSVE